MASLTLQQGETLLRRDRVSLVQGKLANRVGMCYLTDRRVVIISEPLLIGVAGALSVIVRAVLRALRLRPTKQQEIQLRYLSGVSLSKYGLSKTLDIPVGDGSVARLVMTGGQIERWLQALDEALEPLGLERVPEGENSWRIRLAQG